MILVRRSIRDERGQDLIEYGLLTALLSVGFVAAIRMFGGSALAVWTQVVTGLAAAL